MLPPYTKTIREYLDVEASVDIFQKEFCRFSDSRETEILLKGRLPDTNLSNLSKPVEPSWPTNPKGIQFRQYFKTMPYDSPAYDCGVAFDENSSKPVGYIYANSPVCILRRQGIGSHLVAYFDPDNSSPSSSFTKEGYFTRIAAHALLVTWALIGKEDVPEKVLSEYCVYGKKIRLREQISRHEKKFPILPAEAILKYY